MERIKISIEDYVRFKIIEMVYDFDLSADIVQAAKAVKENIEVEYMDNMIQMICEDAEVDYPAGRDAGHRISIDATLETGLYEEFTKYVNIIIELNKYISGEKKV